MSSLIQGYNYDIFISYRQKDNKGDHWVSEFVEALKTELESTFKEEISVYFDINPHDGLLETHDVDASLKEKLKCLIFIPIISQTYCDLKSFAWEHEFKAFVEMASKDQFGLKVKLPNGNVASRVLPVQIHEIDVNDSSLCESVTGGVLRGIDFIFKSAGVNRPLRSTEDHPHDNLNKTYYRDQINKVANAIMEMVRGLKNHNAPPVSIMESNIEQKSLPKRGILKFITVAVVILAFVMAGVIFIPSLLKPDKLERSIAILPFINESPVDSNKYFINGIMEELLNNLQAIGDFRVLSRTSTDKFKGPEKPTIPLIAKELGVNYIVEGSGQKYGTVLRFRVQLIKAKGREDHLWGKSYELELKGTTDLFELQNQIAKAIATELKAVITPDEKLLIARAPTSNMAAYNLFLKAEDYRRNYEHSYDLSAYQTSVNLYNAALEADPAFAKAYVGIADIYFTKYYFERYFSRDFLDTCLYLTDKALEIDDNLAEAWYVKAMYYAVNTDMKEALHNLDKTLKLNPNHSLAYKAKGNILTSVLFDYQDGILNYQKALSLISGEERAPLISSLARAYLDAGFVEKSRKLYAEAYNLDHSELGYLRSLVWLEFSNGNFSEALNHARKAAAIDSTFRVDQFIYSLVPDNKEEALHYAGKLVQTGKNRGDLLLFQAHRIGYAYYMSGKKEEADYYFGLQMKFGEDGIKLKRILTQMRAFHYDLAATYAFLGQKEKAYRLLEEFGKLDFYQLWWLTLIKNDPLFENLRGEERFQNLIHEMEVKHNIQHEKVRKWLEESNML